MTTNPRDAFRGTSLPVAYAAFRLRPLGVWSTWLLGSDPPMTVLELQKQFGADLVVIYDDQCVFCSAHVRLMRLRDTVGKVQLIDARTNGIADQVFREIGLDLDRGMIVFFRNKCYYGPDAMTVLALLTTPSGIINRGMAAIFRSTRASRALYPILRLGRRIGLATLGRPAITIASDATKV